MHTWLILAAWGGAVTLLIATQSLRRWLTGRRKDREWFAYIVSKPRGAEALEWLRGGPDVWRLGCLRTAPPGLPEDGADLEEWERDEWDRIEAFYRRSATDPNRKHWTTGELS